jgi:hypothetical protein
MKFIQELLNNLFFKITRSSAPQSTKDEIVQILNKTIDDVSAGTKRIDDQIADLRALERQIDEITQNRTSLGTADDLEFTKFKTENTALDDLLNEFSTKTGASPEEARRVLIEKYNEGYPPGSPKRMSDEDDDRLRAFIESQKLMGNEQDLMIDVLENAQLPEDQLRAIREIAEEGDDLPFGKSGEAEEFIKNRDTLPFGKSGEAETYVKSISDEIDDMIKATQQKNTDLARVEELMMNPDNFGKSFDEILQMVQDEKVIPIDRSKKAEGGIMRIGLQDGGGPKIGRRGFLGMLGAGIGSLMMPKGVKKVAEMAAPAARVIKPTPGMPEWFPFLVNQIKTKGKITREPDYKDFTSGGDTNVVYKLKDKNLSGGDIILEEDMQSGIVSVYGRGDDGQQVSMDYFPGDRTATKQGVQESPPSFEVGEFFKGEIQDYENLADTVDDLRGGLISWEKVSGIGRSPKEKIERMMKNFGEEFKNPNIEPGDDFIKKAQGGGVGSLFKERTA